MRGGDKYLMKRKAKHFGFLTQIRFSIWYVGFFETFKRNA
jgi:hypothetical protein